MAYFGTTSVHPAVLQVFRSNEQVVPSVSAYLTSYSLIEYCTVLHNTPAFPACGSCAGHINQPWPKQKRLCWRNSLRLKHSNARCFFFDFWCYFPVLVIYSILQAGPTILTSSCSRFRFCSLQIEQRLRPNRNGPVLSNRRSYLSRGASFPAATGPPSRHRDANVKFEPSGHQRRQGPSSSLFGESRSYSTGISFTRKQDVSIRFRQCSTCWGLMVRIVLCVVL